MTRDSPPELARALAGPYASTMRTRRPARCKCQAVQAPKTPAPITATSYPPERRAAGAGSAATAASFSRSRRRITGSSRCARRAAGTRWESRRAARRSPRVAASPVARGRAALAGPLREHASSHEKRLCAGDGLRLLRTALNDAGLATETRCTAGLPKELVELRVGHKPPSDRDDDFPSRTSVL